MASPKHSTNLHLGAKTSVYQHAKDLRHTQTEAEQKLWALLRNKQLKGKKFRRQHVLIMLLTFIVMSVSWLLSWMGIIIIVKNRKSMMRQERFY